MSKHVAIHSFCYHYVGLIMQSCKFIMLSFFLLWAFWGTTRDRSPGVQPETDPHRVQPETDPWGTA